MKLHYQNSDIAAKMLAYDHVAWVSSDSVQTLSEEELSTYGGQLDSFDRGIKLSDVLVHFHFAAQSSVLWWRDGKEERLKFCMNWF